MNAKPKIVALCDEPRVMRAIATQTRTWVDLYEAPDADRLYRLLENHEDASVVITQLILRRDDGVRLLLDLRNRHPLARRCLLAACTDLSRVVDAIHHGLIDALIHVPLVREQFLNAISGPSPAALADAALASEGLAA